MSEIIKAVILGIVEGLTEFLPVSSTGHLIVVNEFINFTGPFAKLFDIVIQLGAILAVVVYFWKRLNPFNRRQTALERSATWDIWKKTLVGVAPALLVGAAFGKRIEAHLFNPTVVALTLLLGGLVLILVEGRARHSRISSIGRMNYSTALAIGFIQCLAMIPGTSRSAATIIGAILLGASRTVAAEFSFFLAVPTLLAASAYSLLKTDLVLSGPQIQALLTGFIISFGVAWLVIAGFLQYVAKRDFKLFGYYRIFFGVFLLVHFLR
ncbi:undecaprenyl-diphosphatase [Hydrogenispora ethanolica]|uniref:Undecaprenyl-diphosphatase n=1 Tax=Hydrogenispora ethanolica TaxID=1082276 RepID=A0A4R1SBN4_HYDET|nr:undecaprenyl-diphosphate phosphatase [Hydrogenispora ethanolica]TCL76975.1 undecaprenyl-diphosphatase [Hydrogenispora ethanolica]